MVLRFVEMAGQSGTVNVRIPLLKAEAAWRCNLMEEDGETLPVTEHGFSFAAEPFQIITMRVAGPSAL